MTRAHWLRFGVGFGVGVVAVALVFATHPPALGIAVGIPVFVLTSLIAERLFRRYASVDEIKRDLEDRVRHPAS
jgi:biopolymer transport protein ExbB/TolQ